MYKVIFNGQVVHESVGRLAAFAVAQLYPGCQVLEPDGTLSRRLYPPTWAVDMSTFPEVLRWKAAGCPIYPENTDGTETPVGD
jgi:hypothetical protein